MGLPKSSESFPLSLSQQNIRDLELRYSGTSINVISATVRISGRVDFSLLSETLNRILASDASLRTRLVPAGTELLQEYAPAAPEIFPVFDFSLTDPAGFSHWETAVTRESMPLYGAPLCRFYLFRTGVVDGGVLIKSHHIIMDGWSQVLLCNRIAETYLALLSGKDPQPEPSPDYKLHIDKELQYLDSAGCRADERYWRGLLETPAEPVSFKEQRGASVSPVGRRLTYTLPETLNHAIYTFCQSRRVSPFSPYYMALAIAARRMGAGRRIAVGVPIHNRTDLIARQTTGMFVSTLPLITELDEDWTAEEFNDRLSETWLELLRHQRYPFQRIEALPGHDGRLFRVALSYQDNLSYKNEDTTVRFSGRWNYGGYQAEQLCIHVTNLEDNRRYTVDYDYLAQLFTNDEIERLHGVICTILDQILSHPGRPIREVNILTADDREKVLYTFNRTAAAAPGEGLWATLSAAAAKHPRRAALIDGEGRVTYEALCRRAMAMAPAIRTRCGEGEAVVAVMLSRGSELGCALAGVLAAGKAFLLLSPDLPAARAAGILKASGAALLITAADVPARFAPGDLSLPVLIADTLPHTAAGFVAPAESADDLAYVVYTSGSTGQPKGVEISAGNLLNFAAGMKPVFSEGAMLSISNVSFDAFILECLTSLLNGLTVVFADYAQQEDPAALARVITDYGVDYLCMTPSRLQAYLESPEFRAAMRGRKGLLCGGEAFSGDLLRALKNITDAHLYNQYGPSEATVGVSLARLDHCGEISVGSPMPNCALYVLDDRLEPLPLGVYGELYIGGKCVGRGYRNAPELTEKAFLPDPFIAGGRMYRSGDMACWTSEGALLLRGRRDRQLKIRGQRAEPDELAFCLMGHPAVRKAAVKAVEAHGQTVLCAYCVAEDGVTEGELLHYLGERLPLYLLPARILKMDTLPLTPSGKVDEKALPDPELSGGDSAPETPQQERILRVFRDVLGTSDIGADGDYFLFGGNSLNAMEALARLEDVLGRRIRISDLYACRTAKRLEEWLCGGQGAGCAAPLQRAGAQDSYPVSPIQENIYVQCGMAPDSMAYHMPGAFRLSFAPDRARLERAFTDLIAQDDLFRTAFVLEKGALRAKILPEVHFELPLAEGTLEQVWRDFLRPFDLAAPPLLRAALWRDAEGNYGLLMDVHHIVGDGLSTPILLKRLDALYAGGACAPAYTYKDYCCWKQREDGAAALDAWSEHLAAPPAPLDLPTDRPRPHPFDFKGDVCVFSLPPQTAEACRALCRERELTPFMVFAAAFGLLLGRLSGREELLLGTPVSGRSRSELWQVCGPFIATLPLRVQPGAERTVSGYLAGLRRETLWLLEHQELPLDQVLNKLELPRALGENPLFQVLFTYRPLDVNDLTLGGGPLRVLDTPHTTAKMDLTLEGAESGGDFSFALEYASSLFERDSAALYARCFVQAVAALCAAEGDAQLGTLELLDTDDRLRLLTIPRQTVTPFRNATMDALFSEQAARTPDAPAVIFRGETVTFAQLETMALRCAGLLQQAGIAPGGRVGLCCRRGAEIFAGMLAILKNGCAYVPFLADFPEQRIRYMLETAEISAVLCGADCVSAVQGIDGVTPVVMLDEGAPFAPVARAGGLAYILFTSGSTGKPKGVMVPNRAVANYCINTKKVLSADGGNVLCIANMTFDIFMTEGLLPLTMGRTVILADEEERALPWRMAKLIRDNAVTTVQITPSQIRLCLGNEDFRAALKDVRLLILTGEASSAALVGAVSAVTDAALVDLYGPTETTVYASSSTLAPGQPVTIGKPYQNCRLYVLDPAGREVLPTARGELYIAGECLSSGYVGRPELTEKAFVPDPFFPGETMYRTGDIARLRADGHYDCLGREDAQVKVNGLRIELDEINGAAVQSGFCRQCVTTLCHRADGSAYLRAFAVPEGVGEERALRRSMEKLLPEYMMPSEFVFLDAIPVNASGKADLPALAAYAPGAPAPVPATPKAPARSAGGAEARDVWREALERDDISDTESFFRQGGTSLAALSVLTGYYERGFNMTLADFYAHPTLREQEALLAQSAPVSAGIADDAPRDTVLFVPRPAPSAPPALASLPAKCALLTGATGFLGAHLLRELLESGRADTVLCLLRDGDRARLLAALIRYFGADWCAENSWRVSAAKGDVAQPRFGMETDQYAILASRVGAVFHCAADVRHYASDGGSLDTNVAGTVNAADFALAVGVPFNHVSTLSVSGEYLLRDPEQTAVFTEADFDIGQNWQDNIYVRGKFLAEREVYDRVERGLCGRVFRLGRLVGRDSDGVFQPNPRSNAVYLTFRGVQAVGAIPRSMAAMPMDLTPIDFTARAIAALSSAGAPVCHIADPAPIPMGDAVRAIAPDVAVVEDGEFSAKLTETAHGPRAADAAPLIEIWNRALRAGPARITPDWAKTTALLNSLGVAPPSSGPEVRLKEYAVSFEEGVNA